MGCAESMYVHFAVQILCCRSSSLTRVLMECFVKEDARMAVIATVSPNPTDTEHIVSTLRTACMISGSDGDCRELKEDVPMTVQMQREAQRQVR